MSSEARDAERRKVLGGFAAAFLMGAGYSRFEVDGLGDLSDVGAERIRELLTAKLQEQKSTLEWAKKRHFRGWPEAGKPQEVAGKRRA
jgi:hypothetical protein